MTHLETYADLIRRGEIVAGYWIRKEIQNLVADLQDGRFVYDTTEADKRIRFMSSMCLQSKYPYYGKPIELMPWETSFIESLYSFKFADSGKRRFIEAIIEIARKNGKSTLLAGDGMADLFIGAGGTEICCASNDDKQARYIWREIAGMRSRLDPHRAMTSQNLVEIRNESRNIAITRMSSKTQNKDGANFGKTYLDEAHDIDEEEGNSEIAEACWRSMSTRDDPLFVTCTTQGFSRTGCWLDKKIEKAKRVIEGEDEDVRFLPFLYEQDSEAEIWQDEASWEKSNPSIRYGVKKIEILRRDVELAKTDKATRLHCLCKDFNVRQESGAATWLMAKDFSYEQDPFDLEDFRGAYALFSVDLSATTDLASVKGLLMKQNDPTKYVISHYFIPETKLEKSDDKSAGAEYTEWARQGLLTIHEGTEVDIEAVADWIGDLYRDYKIKPFKIAYDERFAKMFIRRCDDYYGFETEMILQGRALSSAMKLTEAELKRQSVNFSGNPVDKWCLANCCAQVDNLGNIQPIKQAGHAAKRIDGAVTLIMLFEIFRRYRSDFLSKIGG